MTLSTSYSSTFSQISHYLNEVIESNENWRKIKDSLISLKALFTPAAAAGTNFSTDVDAIAAPLVKCISSEHSSLSLEAMSLSAHLSCELKTDFTAHVNQVCPALIQGVGNEDSLYWFESYFTLSTIVANVKSVPVVHQICSAAICKTFSVHRFSAMLFCELINSFDAQLLLQSCDTIENVFSQGLLDPKESLQDLFCSSFQTYIDKLPLRLDHLTKSLPEEVLKFFDQSKTMSSAQSIQESTHSMNPASQAPSLVQTVKELLTIQVGSAASPSSIAHSDSSASRIQLSQGTINNEKTPDYSHIKSKYYQGCAPFVEAHTACQSPSKVKTAIKLSKLPKECLKVKVFSKDSKYILTTIKEESSPKKRFPFPMPFFIARSLLELFVRKAQTLNSKNPTLCHFQVRSMIALDQHPMPSHTRPAITCAPTYFKGLWDPIHTF
ncbi:hypothetical protein DSO57_1007527 [Entomophthora muscae]|uniref:Uncharacterized protein n=1 Tax=Entomophthora muscae TaxID=34485 RepID=A0ACC2USS9_9FUNG|nr:hypothetical protein DSO57_1007527 [Entomophthora muscae]